jgi:acylpyruvate hydrolase
MIFDIPTLIAFLSQGTTLEAGSIIMTGTPAGVGFVMDPPQYLTHGDTVEIWIEGVGTLMNPIKHAA